MPVRRVAGTCARCGSPATGASTSSPAVRVSKGVLLALEGDRGNPRLTTLCRLADAFSVSLTELVDTRNAPVLRRASIGRGQHACGAARPGHRPAAAVHRPAAPVELWWWRLSGEVRRSEAHASGTREGPAGDRGRGRGVRGAAQRGAGWAPRSPGPATKTTRLPQHRHRAGPARARSSPCRSEPRGAGPARRCSRTTVTGPLSVRRRRRTPNR